MQQAIIDVLLKSSKDSRTRVFDWVCATLFFGVLMHFLSTLQTVNLLFSWCQVARTLQFNDGKAKTHVEPSHVASDGMMLNLCAALLKFCKPFAAIKMGPKKRSLGDDIDVQFIVGGSPAFSLSNTERIGVFKVAESESADEQLSTPANATNNEGDDEEEDNEDDLYDAPPEDEHDAEERRQLKFALAQSMKPAKPEEIERNSDKGVSRLYVTPRHRFVGNSDPLVVRCTHC